MLVGEGVQPITYFVELLSFVYNTITKTVMAATGEVEAAIAGGSYPGLNVDFSISPC
ncbi:MAG TPA: hypothetical protein VNZ03_32380 [Terriglobales bacterium]|jgi:hypothetical protein|nr:hypothetical protein [Terriglobales bacterium]